MKNDIKTRADIELLVDNFYIKVKSDKLIGHFLTEIVMINWKEHLSLMCDFGKISFSFRQLCWQSYALASTP